MFISNINKIYYCLVIIFIIIPYNILAATNNDHSDDHQQIFHAFTLEADVGEARDSPSTSSATENKNSKGFDLSGWVGGDYNRLWINSEKKNYGNYEQKFEAQALYSRNFTQFWDAQIGVAHDFSTDFTPTNVNYFVIGLEGLAPQMFETKAQIFLSDKGNYSARLKQEVDIFITQKLITQPYFETELFAQNVNKLEVKSGISDLEIGAETRYEITRKFAPYFALRYHTKTFGTADLAKQLGQKVDNFIAAVGIRLRF
jgi:copper resistance protein B